MEGGAYIRKTLYPVSNAYMGAYIEVGIITGIIFLLAYTWAYEALLRWRWEGGGEGALIGRL